MLNVDYTASLESEDYHLYLVWGHPYEGTENRTFYLLTKAKN